MSKVYLYIKGMALSAIDSYCSEHHVSRSRFMVDSALRAIRSSKPDSMKCEYCSKESAIGEFKMTVYSTELGEEDKVVRLGANCLRQAEKEGVPVTRID